jgi:plastocyanin
MYYFCSANEAKAFEKNPGPYIALYDELTFGKPKAFSISAAVPHKIAPGQPALIALAVREQGKQALTTRFQLVHEKLMHLIMVSDDLSWFAHEHPELRRDGRFYLRQSFPRDGRYYLYSDFTPADGVNQVLRSEVRVGTGITRKPQRLTPDQTLTKTVDGVTVNLKLSTPLVAGRQSLLTYTLSRNGQPVTDMTPYLGAMGHLMAISQSGRQAVHTHAVSTGTDPRTGLSVTPEMSTAAGPTQTFKLQLPTGGLYRVWAQFGIGGKILTVPFTFATQENTMKTNSKIALTMTGAAMAAATMNASAAPKAPPAQKITITLPDGYKSGAATVKAGKPVALTFKLKSDAGCGNTVSVPAAKWSKTLKVGEQATLLYTPKKSGALDFQCGMGMYRGTVVVR